MSHVSVAVVVHNGADRPVDRELLKVDTDPTQLSVLVTEVPSLKQRIIRESNAWRNVSSTESDLLGLREILVRVAIQFKLADVLNGHKLFGPDLGGVEYVKFELVFLAFRNYLHTKVPPRVGLGLDGLPEICRANVSVW